MHGEAAGDDSEVAESHEAPEDRADPPEAADDDQIAETGTDDPEAASDPEPPGGPALEFLPAEEASQEPADTLTDVPAPDDVDSGIVPEVPVVEWDGEVEHDPSDDRKTTEQDHAPPDVVHLQPQAGGNGASRREQDDAHNGEEAASVGPATMPFGVDSPELFDMDAEEDDEFIEQLRQVVSSDAPLPDKDAAMAAFFDHDEGAGS